MSKRIVVLFSTLLILVAGILALVALPSWISSWRQPVVTGEGVNATYQWSLSWDRSMREGNYPIADVFLSVDGRVLPLSGGSLGPQLRATVANPGERAALDLSVVYTGGFGSTGHQLQFPVQVDQSVSAPYQVTFLENRRVHVGDTPVLLMRLELLMTTLETDFLTSLPRVVELWVGREFPTAQ